MSEGTGVARAIACEIVAALIKGDRESGELCDMVACTRPTVRAWLKSLHEAGLIREVHSQTKSARWSWQSVPFERADFAP